MRDHDARLTELEIALTHQDRTVEELSGMVRALATRLDRLERRLADLAERLADTEARAGGAATDRPPHW